MASLAHHATGGLAVPTRSLPRPGWRGLGIAGALVFALSLIDGLVHRQTRFDVWALRAIQGWDLPGLATLFHHVEKLTAADGSIRAWALAIVTVALLRWWLAAGALFTLPLAGIINLAFGEVVDRTRPHIDGLVRTAGDPMDASFPSGHVMGAVVFYGLLIVVARRVSNGILRLAVQGTALGIIATVGFARIWQGAHWPTDVIAAYALGLAFLAPLAWLYLRLDATLGRLPLISAGRIAHDERQPHAHALTSLVLFEGQRVVKVYNPGLLPRVLYWLAFQAPFPYVGNRAALRAAVARRNLAALLTRGWYGTERVARAEGIVTRNGRPALAAAYVAGTVPTLRADARAFLTDLRRRFEEAGLPTWQIDPRQPRALDNILETADGSYVVVDLESGLVSPLAGLTTWKRALRRGLVPFFDEVFFDVTRDYVARDAARLRAGLGAEGYAELLATLDEAERAATEWRRGEPRLLSKLLRWSWIAVDVRGWPRRTRALLTGSREQGTLFAEKAVATWETEGRITPAEAATLREQIAAPTFQAMLPYLGAHILVSIPLRFPFGSIARTLMVIGAMGYETGRLLRRRSDRHQWRQAMSIHSPLVALMAAVPGFGSFAYLAARPVRANRLLLRTVLDTAMHKVPWQLYERSGLRRVVARPAGSPVAGGVPTGDEADLTASHAAEATPGTREGRRAEPPVWSSLGVPAIAASTAPILPIEAPASRAA